MRMKTFIAMPAALLMAILAVAAQAKLPAQTPEQQAAAAATKDKAGWADKVAAYKLCLAQDKTAERYFKTKEGAQKPTANVPPCTDPGPYVPQATQQVGVADAKPVPDAGKPEAPAKKQ
jgi:hypothetical protein